MMIDEWENFLERKGLNPKDEGELEDRMDDILHWASLRGQTLTRTGKITRFIMFIFTYYLFSNCYFYFSSQRSYVLQEGTRAAMYPR